MKKNLHLIDLRRKWFPAGVAEATSEVKGEEATLHQTAQNFELFHLPSHELISLFKYNK